jgi:membrane-bound lytic murein transglycosylase MltF
VNGFVKTAKKGTLLGNILLKRYLQNTEWIKDALADDEIAKFQAVVDTIEAYADRYEFDWLMIAAQGYQESKLDQSTVSPAGAIGVMQILPSTAADPNVAIADIELLDSNAHAGVKYLRFLRDRYFSDPAIAPLDQELFSFAAYNAGPGNIAKARAKAAAMGFDPNRWFQNVEFAAAKVISQEPVRYVRNIYKYYVAYRMLSEQAAAQRAAKAAAKTL